MVNSGLRVRRCLAFVERLAIRFVIYWYSKRNVSGMNETALKETLWYVGESYANGSNRKPVQSDKVYLVELYPDGTNSIGTRYWSVKASWGRRGKALQSQIKCNQSGYLHADYIFQELISAKLDKGYKRWEFVTEVEDMHTMIGYDA